MSFATRSTAADHSILTSGQIARIGSAAFRGGNRPIRRNLQTCCRYPIDNLLDSKISREVYLAILRVIVWPSILDVGASSAKVVVVGSESGQMSADLRMPGSMRYIDVTQSDSYRENLIKQKESFK